MNNIIWILILQLLYVPCFTLRTIFIVKQLRTQATILGAIEALIYIFGLSLVFDGEQSFMSMLVYALGFSIGIFVGTLIEEKLAIGYTAIQVNIPTLNQPLIDRLRQEGYGVTVFEGTGRDSVRYKLEILTKRNQEEGLYDLICDYQPNAFIITYEPRKFKGGYLLKAMKRRKRKSTKKAPESSSIS
ncbi:hypothetical protein CSV79_11505 [Sporosarcina sp. P13]|uniref:DUF2179 domain-containing protein n=1 Tax=Sporosarcina sp. P13 TaxID=2048263 RepID=UPI000C16EFFF|nr:DUF2179 domain-containing protein [Sporosarcina sp. P13]PIC63498.1 hypothetical protein CSV79_11505 [Sporosarcina sp. P13]